MYKHSLKNKILLILIVVVMALSVISQDAYARGGRGGWGGRGHWGGRGGRGWGGGRWYDDGWFWFDAGITALTLGSVVSSLPPYCTTVYDGGMPYYYCNGMYYRPYPNGYVVVQAPVETPVMVQQPATLYQPAVSAPTQNVNIEQAVSPATQGEPFTVNVPNFKGGWTSVTLTRSGTGFIGPQGEYYPEFPKIKQLKEMYGK